MIEPKQRRRRGWSEGSIYQRTDGRWVGSVSLGYDGNGKRKRRFVYCQSKIDVQKELRKLQSSADAGMLADSSRVTVEQFVNAWLENVAKPKVRLTTLERYEQLARLHVVKHLGGIQVARLRAAHIESFYASLEKDGQSGRSRQAAGQLLGAVLSHAVKTNLIPFSPMTHVPKPRPDHREMTVLTSEQVRKLLDAAKPRRLYPLIALAVATGMRQGELLGLKWQDFDLSDATVTVRRSLAQTKAGFMLKEPKTKASARTITLPAFAVDALIAHRAMMLAEGNIAAPVFCTRTGEHIEKGNLAAQVFRPIVAEAKLSGVRFHDLRHAHASQLLSAGESVKAVSQRLGHASAKMTLQVYAHIMPADDKRLAANLDRLYG